MGEGAWMGHQRRPSLKQTPPGMREWEGIRIGEGWESIRKGEDGIGRDIDRGRMGIDRERKKAASRLPFLIYSIIYIVFAL